jgi:DNA-binding HxlR family transcriptional regulator
MKRTDVKSRCPINYTMEIFGDPWSMLIIRGMVSYGAKYFGDFLKSEERIGTSVLADRLVHLEKKGIITKQPDRLDKRKMTYSLTETGLSFIPIVYDIAAWGTQTSPSPKVTDSWIKAMGLNRDMVIKAWREAVTAGSAFYVGPDSVIEQLSL